MKSIEKRSVIPKKNARGISLTTLGWDLALPIFGGVLLGYQIDNKIIGSGYLFTFLFLIIGVIVGYYNLYKFIHLELLRTELSNRKLHNQEDA